MTGRPECRLFVATSKSNSLHHNSLPFREALNVVELPIMIIPLRARERRTLTRSGEYMNPMSPLALLRVKEMMTISDSSPW